MITQRLYIDNPKDPIRQRALGRRLRSAWEQFCTGYQRPSAEEIAADKALTQAELSAGHAAYLAGIALDDAILTPLGRQGWNNARRQWAEGQRLARTDILDRHPHLWETWSEAKRGGYAEVSQCAAAA
jgi:hypothetical protein